ncbi:hypothetical protein [Micromonospora sp. NPDC005806]|uniref:hypothetical protein n=1 Tax=Micromonospora sp. NPDC005806 TaxID=3364234 RepID=UPI0036AA3485
MLELAKLDFAGAVPESDDMEDEDWRIAMLAYYESRVDRYTNMASGEIVFEPHDDEGDPVGVGE